MQKLIDTAGAVAFAIIAICGLAVFVLLAICIGHALWIATWGVR